MGVPSGTTRRGKVTFTAQDRSGSLDPERSTDSERGEMREPRPHTPFFLTELRETKPQVTLPMSTAKAETGHHRNQRSKRTGPGSEDPSPHCLKPTVSVLHPLIDISDTRSR